MGGGAVTLVTHLVVAQPDAAVCHAEADNMVKERLHAVIASRRAERLRSAWQAPAAKCI